MRCDALDVAEGSGLVHCSGCKTAGLLCTFNQKGPSRGPPKGYVEYLEGRLDKIEELVAKVRVYPPILHFLSYSHQHNSSFLPHDLKMHWGLEYR